MILGAICRPQMAHIYPIKPLAILRYGITHLTILPSLGRMDFD